MEDRHCSPRCSSGGKLLQPSALYCSFLEDTGASPPPLLNPHHSHILSLPPHDLMTSLGRWCTFRRILNHMTTLAIKFLLTFICWFQNLFAVFMSLLELINQLQSDAESAIAIKCFYCEMACFKALISRLINVFALC